IILLVADMQEITADPVAPARGVIIESHKDQRRGFVATVLVQNGALRIGDWIVAGHVIGKVKSMDDFRGKSISEAGPAVPVAIAGWPESPQVGAEFNTAIAKRAAEDLAADNVTPPPVAFDTFRNTGSSEQSEEKQTLNVLFKADVASSIEAINQSVADINHDEVQFRVLGSSVGDINEADVQTAAAKGAIIYAFRVGIDSATTKRAERDGIRIRSFDVIYELTDALREDLATLLPSATERTAEGTLKILAIFRTDAKSRIIGGKVVSGSASRGALIDLVRGDERIRVGRLVGVQHNKEDRESVAQGLEAGLRIDTSAFTGDISVGDTLEFVREQTVKRTL
ncbi:MAG: Translation initiation factor IF-2, partial [Candidatus Gottesmanbacteria bacterium GW2011_GWB1_43_11]